MADATYFTLAPEQLHVTNLPCLNGEECSLIIPNASTHGPPTSSAVQVNLGNSSALFTAGLVLTELGPRLLPALLAGIKHEGPP